MNELDLQRYELNQLSKDDLIKLLIDEKNTCEFYVNKSINLEYELEKAKKCIDVLCEKIDTLNVQ